MPMQSPMRWQWHLHEPSLDCGGMRYKNKMTNIYSLVLHSSSKNVQHRPTFAPLDSSTIRKRDFEQRTFPSIPIPVSNQLKRKSESTYISSIWIQENRKVMIESGSNEILIAPQFGD